jgi:AmmeMemoRadiSam system protein B
MKFNPIIILILIFCGLLIIAAGIKLVRLEKNKTFETKQINEDKAELPVIESREMFYNQENFTNALNSVEAIIPRDNIYMAIVPHHLLASEYIASALKMSSGRDINTAVIIGPNHENIGAGSIASVRARWNTPYGFLSANKTLTDYFLTDFKLNSTVEIFAKEHSIGAIAPFVKYYFPKAEILPIVFSSYSDIQDAERVSSWLSEKLPENSLIITSIDFSHYLTEEEADKNDRITEDLILNSDIEKIMRLNNDYVDSPVSLAMALLFAENKKLKPEIIGNANSCDFLIEKSSVTTSYFAIVFSQ